MFGIGPATRVYLARGATDMRKGFDGLFALAQQKLAADPLSGHLFVFCNRDRTRLKMLFWDGSGLWVCAKRLEKGRFSWPEHSEAGGRVVLSTEELTLLLGGMEMSRVTRKNWWRVEPVEQGFHGGQNSRGNEGKCMPNT